MEEIILDFVSLYSSCRCGGGGEVNPDILSDTSTLPYHTSFYGGPGIGEHLSFHSLCTYMK